MFNYTNSLGQPAVFEDNTNYTSSTSTWSISSGIGAVLGAGYTICKSFKIAFELVPTISYKYGKSAYSISNPEWNYNNNIPYAYTQSVTYQTTIKGLSYGLNNSSANITLAYDF